MKVGDALGIAAVWGGLLGIGYLCSSIHLLTGAGVFGLVLAGFLLTLLI